MAIFVEKSKNSKLGGIATTYASIKKTCPDTCKLKNGACYARVGYVGMVNDRLDKKAKNKSSLDIAKKEALLIDKSFGGKSIPTKKDLRLHTGGDSRTKKGTELLAAAARRYRARGGGDVYTYTHSWKRIPKASWKGISVLASCDSTDQITEAKNLGYATAMVVNNFPNDSKAFNLDGHKMIPCPEMTRGISCVDCRLCFNDELLIKINATIAFSVHGPAKGKFHLLVIK
jgi:hypothetical protein